MIAPLPINQLRRTCDLSLFDFETTADLEADTRIIGQPRGTRAIEFGISVEGPGYNIYILGESGTGRTTAIRRFIEKHAADKAVPDDWVYVHNFREAHKPRALHLPAGLGCPFRDAMSQFVTRLQTEIPNAFDTEAFRDAALEIQHALSRKRDQLFARLQVKANQMGAALLSTPEGIRIVPAQDGQPLPPNAIASMPEEQREALSKILHDLEHDLSETLHRARKLEHETEDEMEQLVRRVAASVVDVAVGELKEQFSTCDALVGFLDDAHQDILDNVRLFQDELDDDGNVPFRTSQMTRPELRLRRYKVNVIVDHLRSEHAPVVVEYNPPMRRLLGRVEHESLPGGVVMTDFSLIRGGALHAANGGYLVLRARDLFTEPGAWDALKRALIGGKITPDDPATRGGVATNSLDPEEIPLEVKVIIIGPPQVYYLLYQDDEDFRTTFKVMADFDQAMDYEPENLREYATFVSYLCREENLFSFDRSAVGMIVEYSSRLTGSQKKLSTRFGDIADIVREASFWAKRAGRDVVIADDVQEAINERRYLRNRIETQLREHLMDGKQLIAVDGKITGQINGLSVLQVGDHTFGHPSRVTASTFVGKDGVVQVDREVELAGPIHNKGVMTLIGYLGRKYGDERPLSFSAMLTFEQNYGGIEGDSASSTELYALISSLSGVPIRQSVAVTGSVNQLGEIQPIGGVTQKVEGWYEICKARGFNGKQGALIPATNAEDLMLRKEVVRAVEAGEFHIWAVRCVDEGLEVLTGVSPTEAIHTKAKERLERLAEVGAKYSRGDV
ncbi:MAG: Lon protease family protein [Anaerolineales bacterium]